MHGNLIQFSAEFTDLVKLVLGISQSLVRCISLILGLRYNPAFFRVGWVLTVESLRARVTVGCFTCGGPCVADVAGPSVEVGVLLA